MKINVSCGRAQEPTTVRRTKLYGYPFFGAVSALLAVFAARNEPKGSWVIAGSLSVATAILLVGIALLARGQEPQRVRVAGGPDALCLSPPPAADIGVTLAMGVAFLAVALVWLDPDQVAGFWFQERALAYGAPLFGAYVIVSKLWSLRHPAGLTLSDDGLRGVRGGPLVNVSWDRVVRVSVNETRGVRSVCIVTAETVHVIPMHALVGDAYAIASIATYYLEHPEKRRRLVDGPEAVRHADRALRAERFDQK